MAILIICLWATASFASWSVVFNENGVYGGVTYNITKIEVFKLAGTSGLESPGMSNFTAGSWTVKMPNANYVVATNARYQQFQLAFLIYGNFLRLIATCVSCLYKHRPGFRLLFKLQLWHVELDLSNH